MNFIVLKTQEVLQGSGYSMCIPLKSGRVSFTSFLCMDIFMVFPLSDTDFLKRGNTMEISQVPCIALHVSSP